MSAKDYLLQIKILDQKIKVLTDELCKLEALASKITPSIGKLGVQTSEKNTHEEATIEYIMAAEKLKKLLREYTQKRNEIVYHLVRLDNAEYIDLLYLRYLECKTWETIAATMGYSEKYIYDLHGKALLMLKTELGGIESD